MRILIVYYSNTSTVHQLAGAIDSELSKFHDVSVVRILPRVERSYWNWLARSFLPGSCVGIQPIQTDLQNYDRVCLGFPKWTFSCPPVNRYLELLSSTEGAVFGLFMAFGGFDEDRYLRALSARVWRKGPVVATLAVKRQLAREPECTEAVRTFCAALGHRPSAPLSLKVGR